MSENKIETVKTFRNYLANEAVQAKVKELFKERSQAFIISVTALVNLQENLAECEPSSLIGACITATALELPLNPNLGFVYIIPYKTKEIKKGSNGETLPVIKAQLQFGYKAFIQLAQKSGQLKRLEITDVRAGELLSHDRLTGELSFQWKTEGRDSLKTIGYVGYMQLTNGFEKAVYMTNEELQKHGKRYSQTYRKGYGLWEDNFDAMAKKTLIKLLLSKYAPLSVEAQRAVITDQAVINDIDAEDVEYIDNKPDSLEDHNKEKEDQRIMKFIDSAKTQEELEKIAKSNTLSDELQDYIDAKAQTL